ncbi:MAG TPA: sigma 54-interacting transcriptional regulator, partial [Myxococcota bacterium]|nr:sigma 54-interacting transcriptional regulator [Myxococcota bacterium]
MPRIRSVLWIGDAPADVAVDVAALPHVDLAWVRDVDEALTLPLEGFDALILDAPPGERALDASRRLLARRALPPVVARLAAPDGELARALLAVGVRDVWLPGEETGGLESRLARLELRGGPLVYEPPPRRPVGTPGSASGRGGVSPDIVGRSPAMREVFALLERAQRTSATVLLTGETGTGKEILAREIHRGSERRRAAFVAVNCAAFPDTLLESELFGHVRGSFTGAERDKQGLFELADRGTLFLDEVGETSAPFQAKLLRALQEREVRPVGGTRARKIDVRLVAATNRDLRAAVGKGAFREDLYYRLAVFPIAVPPLRARTEDVLALAAHFLALHGEREGASGCRFSREAERLLLSYRWPGNVRELENEVQRALALAAAPGQLLGPELLSTRLHGVLEPIEAATIEGETLRESLG